MIRGKGLLAIWSDVAPETEVDYRHWLTREHILERVGVDGFLLGRAFRSIDSLPRRYFICYELAEPSALAGPSYMGRLNAPTPWTQKTMPLLKNFARGGGRVVARSGLGLGGHVAPLRCSLANLIEPASTGALVERLVAMDGISAVWLLAVDQDATTLQTKEKAMRKSTEGLFEAVLGIEGLDADPVRAAAKSAIDNELAGLAADSSFRIPLFASMFTLDRRIAQLPPAG